MADRPLLGPIALEVEEEDPLGGARSLLARDRAESGLWKVAIEAYNRRKLRKP